jgi:ferredoxin
MMVGKVDQDEIEATIEAAKACPMNVIQVAGE